MGWSYTPRASSGSLVRIGGAIAVVTIAGAMLAAPATARADEPEPAHGAVVLLPDQSDVVYVVRSEPWHAPRSGVREGRAHEPFVVTDRAWVKREPEAKVWVQERVERAKKTESQVAAARIASGSAISQVLAVVLAGMALAFVPSPRALKRKKATASALRAALHEPGVIAGAGAVSLAAEEPQGGLSLTADCGALSHPDEER